MKLPPNLARAIGLAEWPDTAQARTALARGLSPADRVALLAWAHATLPQPPTLEAWAQLAGVAEQGLRRARRLDVGLRALPVAGRERKPDSEVSASRLRARVAERKRAEGAAKPKRAKKRRRKTAA